MFGKSIFILCLLFLNVAVCSAEIKKGYYPSDHYDRNRAVVSMTTKKDAVEISKTASVGIRFDKTYWFAKPFWSKKYDRYRPVYGFMLLVGDVVKHKIMKPVQYTVDNNAVHIKLTGRNVDRNNGKEKVNSFGWYYEAKNDDVYNPSASKEQFVKNLLEADSITIHFKIDNGKELQYKLSENELKDIRTIIAYDLYNDPQLLSQCPLAYHSPLNIFGF